MNKNFKDYLKIIQESEKLESEKLEIDETKATVGIRSLTRMISNVKKYFDYSNKKLKKKYNLQIKLLTKTGLKKIKKVHNLKEPRIKVLPDTTIHQSFGYNIYINGNKNPISLYIIREEKKPDNFTKSKYYTFLYVYDQRKENTEPVEIANLTVDPDLDWKQKEKDIQTLIRSEIYGPMIK